MVPNDPYAAITVAPVWPALTSARARFCATRSAATRIDAPGLRRSAAAGDSVMPITSGASTISRLRLDQSGCCASASVTTAVEPTSASRTGRCRAAATAPSTTADGAWSPPIASIAIEIIWPRLFLVDRPDLPLAVVAAMGADAVRRLRLVALRAEAGGGRPERDVRAPFGGACLGVSAFWVRHSLYDSRIRPRPLSAASRGSSHTGAQSHLPVLRFVPHCAQSPWHSSWHSGFIGSAR